MYHHITKSCAAGVLALSLGIAVSASSPHPATADAADGVVQVKSAYSMSTTIERLKKDISDKGIMFFSEINQSELASKSGIHLLPSTLLVFGNPPLGTKFLTSNPNSGLDWPVRLLVRQDDKGAVWVAYTDFGWIAHRHHINDRATEFKMASEVVTSITSTVKGP
jgi:uncharacterized protein (DUF302 family)